MAELANGSQTDPLVIGAAQRIAGQARRPAGQIAAIRDFLERRVRFVRDPLEVETLKAPQMMLQEVGAEGQTWGDCDDIATLGAALGKAAGFPAQFVVLRFRERGPYEHVFTELHDGAGWRELDVSRQLQEVPPGAFRNPPGSTSVPV